MVSVITNLFLVLIALRLPVHDPFKLYINTIKVRLRDILAKYPRDSEGKRMLQTSRPCLGNSAHNL